MKLRNTLPTLAGVIILAFAGGEQFGMTQTNPAAIRVSKDYKGTPFHDSAYKGGPQKIPGKVYCAYYDSGGEGVAYHDNTAKNLGSGTLNPANGTYVNEFRMNEGVDISYVKFF